MTTRPHLDAPTAHHDRAVREANARHAHAETAARVAEADARPRQWSLSSTADGSAHLVVLLEGRACWYWTGEVLSPDRARALRFASVADAGAALDALREREAARA